MGLGTPTDTPSHNQSGSTSGTPANSHIITHSFELAYMHLHLPIKYVCMCLPTKLYSFVPVGVYICIML